MGSDTQVDREIGKRQVKRQMMEGETDRWTVINRENRKIPLMCLNKVTVLTVAVVVVVLFAKKSKNNSSIQKQLQ